MKRPADVALLLQRRFANQHRSWLAGARDDQAWPLELSLGIPTEARAVQQTDAVRAWAAEWRDWRGPGELVWAERRWKALGTQRLPASLRLAGPREVAASVGQQQRWDRARQRYGALTERWPVLRQALVPFFDMLADYADADFSRLTATLGWLYANPGSALYPRQLPIGGLDSKWIETRQSMLAALLSALYGQLEADKDFFALCGLKRPPLQVRIRILDPLLRRRVGGLCDITGALDELAQLDLPAHNVLIVENLQTGLAVRDLPSTVAIMALGYSVHLLTALPWIRPARCFYWGDIDTHGFAILNGARKVLPGMHSLLMDEETLLRHRALWSVEPVQHGAARLDQLDEGEAMVYQKLRAHALGENVRLEQERIGWSYAWTAIESAIVA